MPLLPLRGWSMSGMYVCILSNNVCLVKCQVQVCVREQTRTWLSVPILSGDVHTKCEISIGAL
jgi:hypothetical protein